MLFHAAGSPRVVSVDEMAFRLLLALLVGRQLTGYQVK
jgi:hypothetical protein